MSRILPRFVALKPDQFNVSVRTEPEDEDDEDEEEDEQSEDDGNSDGYSE